MPGQRSDRAASGAGRRASPARSGTLRAQRSRRLNVVFVAFVAFVVRVLSDHAFDKGAERIEAIASIVRVVIAPRSLRVGQVGAVPRRLELMALVPFVE